jgi:(1->4)-alpha-D-glucan 1-alpha-D-glucosylmutase
VIRTPPTATYRLQMRGSMTFEAAAEIAPYLRRLGISHLYLSPIFEAAPGSTHGYDVTDCNKLDPLLGGDRGFETLCAALEQQNLKSIVDFVPNHMAVTPDNRWWNDVLEWGQEARHAHHFDIDWSQPKLLLPVLAGSYGEALAAGEFRIVFDGRAGIFHCGYGDLKLPLRPPSYAEILQYAGIDEDDLAALFAASTPSDVERLKQRLSALSSRSGNVDRLDRACSNISGDVTALHKLLEAQAWRVVHWRLGREKLSYRRFFEITGLVGLSVERPYVFDDVHHALFALVRAGKIEGIRLDHIDGLVDPTEYLKQLQCNLGPDQLFYLLVEKILGPHERLRTDWPVAGTTGYEFANLLTALHVEPAGEAEITRAYEIFRGEHIVYGALATDCKRAIFTSNLAAELNRLVDRAAALAEGDITTRDLGRDALRSAIVEVATAMPVYRTYLDGKSTTDAVDREIILRAVADAQAARRVDDADALDFLAEALLLGEKFAARRKQALAFMLLFQQTTGPVMAKAIEDTAFYRYNRLIALNEVGGEPSSFGLTLDAFHGAMAARQKQQPLGLSTTASHDTKRGEDARARLCVISEIPEVWRNAVERWRSLNVSCKSGSRHGAVLDGDTEWLFYEALLGAWPCDLEPSDSATLVSLASRMSDYMLKAVREAKLHSSWASPNKDYEAAVGAFVAAVFVSRSFIDDFSEVVAPILITGALNGLSQTILKVAAPGVPDIYQGSEAWDLSLVDPDNRRAVDYVRMIGLLDEVNSASPGHLLHNWRRALPKMRILARGLALRRRNAALFAEGNYVPIATEGPMAERAVAFARIHEDLSVIVIAPRFAHGLLAGTPTPHVPPASWVGTAVRLPKELADTSWRNVMTDDAIVEATDGSIMLRRALADFPVALLVDDKCS